MHHTQPTHCVLDSLSGLYFLRSCVLLFDVKLRDSTSQSAQDRRKQIRNKLAKRKERKKGRKKRHDIVDVKLMSFTLNPHLFPPTDKNSNADPAHNCWWALEGAELSHSEGDEAVVSLDVPLEDL